MKKIIFYISFLLISTIAFAQPEEHGRREGYRNHHERSWQCGDSAAQCKKMDENCHQFRDKDAHRRGKHYEKRGRFFMPLGVMLGVVLIAVAFLYFNYKTKKSLHQVMIKAMESGRPIPTELLRPVSNNSDFKKGVILICVGLGVMLGAFIKSGFACGNLKMWGIGVIPLFIGLGYMIIFALEKRNKDLGKGIDEKSL